MREFECKGIGRIRVNPEFTAVITIEINGQEKTLEELIKEGVCKEV